MSSTDLKEAEYLLEAYGWCSDEDRAHVILGFVRVILAPFLEAGDPRALWLKSTFLSTGEEDGPVSDEAFEFMYLELLRESSEGGCAEAQYDYGCHLYEQSKKEEAVRLYEKSAIQGYDRAQWCFGLDTLNGVGTPKDEVVGIHYIRLSAEQQYEYAVEFMIRNCKEGMYGLQADEAGKWQLILSQVE